MEVTQARQLNIWYLAPNIQTDLGVCTRKTATIRHFTLVDPLIDPF